MSYIFRIILTRHKITMKIIDKLLFLLVSLALMAQEVLSNIPNPYKVLGIPKDANEDQIK